MSSILKSLMNDNIICINNKNNTSLFLLLLLGLYVILARDILPECIIVLFKNPLFCLFAIGAIIYVSNTDTQLGLIMATAFLMTIHMINKKDVEKFGNKRKKRKKRKKSN